jgi:hypothetical protein
MCSLWKKNGYIIGMLYITPNFVCFQSNFTVSGKDIKVKKFLGNFLICELVIALNEVTSIDKKSISFGILQNAMTITVKGTREVINGNVTTNYSVLLCSRKS